MKDRIWELTAALLLTLFLPLVSFYHAICANPFLNISIASSSSLENMGNSLLTPFQYLFAGKEAHQNPDGSWTIQQRFAYQENLLPKSIASLLSLPNSLLLGGSIKALSLINLETKKRYRSLQAHLASQNTQPQLEMYQALGIRVGDLSAAPFISSLGLARRPGDENHMAKAKEALRDIAGVLNEASIPWWVDCGTLLGTYRYGGIIPWDEDLDLALLLPDFENARKAFNKLSPEKYAVQDWSGREFPSTFFKIYVKETKEFIDIYFYEIDPVAKECRYLFSFEKNLFFFEWFKERERRFQKPIAFDKLFPLKRALFDGIEVFVPNETVSFLQRYYGENLAPAKIYDSQTNRFEKDLTHPYWQTPYVH